ncbi:MAG: TonB-dependent receptor [Candidatus Rokubacteria bacterium]|nr:TonB-dependent receptor [Candidatus Rokubacteria bacterium]
MKHVQLVSVVWFLVLVLPVPRSTSAEEAKRLEPVVVTATKVETRQAELGASVTVITGEELRLYDYPTADEALRTVPGVQVERSGGFGKASILRIRGANPNQVQVLVDGMRVKSPTSGQFDLSEVTLDAVERIEIVRGPQSTLHGADAIGGVVNIITKKGSGPPQATLEVEGGSWNTFRERASASGGLGGFNAALSASRLDTRGQQRTFDNDDAEQTAFGGRVGYDFPWKGSVSLTGRYSKLEVDVPIEGFPPFRRDPDSQQQTEFALLTARYDQEVLPWWSVGLRAGHMWDNLGFQDGPLPPGDFAFTSQIDTRRREVELLNRFRTGPNDLVVGLEHRQETGEIRDTFRESIDTQAAFLQNQLALFERVFLGAGIRVEDNEVFGTEWTPRVSLAVHVKETDTRLRGAWAQGFRAPTINDLFFPDLTGGFCPPFGNPGLKPEASESWEAGVEQNLWQNRVRLGATWFRTTFRDLITVVSLPPFCSQAGNVGRAETSGVELVSDLEPLDWLHVNVNYTFTEAEDVTNDRELPRIPRHQWNAGVTITPLPTLSLFAQSFVVSRRFDPVANADTPGYHRIDVGGTYRLLARVGRLDALDLTARIQNVTDNTYAEVIGFPALGLTALVGLRASFR